MAAVRIWVERNRYHDSVSLMAVAEGVRAVPGVLEAVLVMGTPMNQALLARVDLLGPEAAAAGPMDLVVGVKAVSEEAAEAGLAAARQLLSGGPALSDAPYATGLSELNRGAYHTLRAAVRAEPDLNFAFISVPGAYAVLKARRALLAGLDVMLYSDNVSIEAEVELKRLACERHLLCLGPDCGTAILDGVGLGFANTVRRGPIGIVAASGTGAQELSVLIDRMGSGISHLIGVGGRDLSAQVGGLMSIAALSRLQADPGTELIVLVAKPPAPEVRALVEASAAAGPKPVLLCFLDGSASIDDVAVEAVHRVTGRPALAVAAELGGDGERVGPGGRLFTVESSFLPPEGRTKVIGLFSGGSLCDQALAILEAQLGRVACNVHPVPEWRVETPCAEHDGHLLLDLGSDEFTRGRPHPMIDFGLRREFIRWAADRPTTGAILLDVVLGWGANPDPAGAMAEAIQYATWQRVPVVASVTGTEADRQGYSKQVARLKEAGAILLPTARQAAQVVARSLAERGSYA
ncbi:MAG TPA: succinyl-CoA synthetase subunit alpha [Symbiobacteriaceae bacterium]|nr:succinyl-CoA synthetase subunit alpha [Symbiobacteriaceae bacterium]